MVNLPRIISAGAGSGKTYRLVEELFTLLSGPERVRPEGIIVTTFTRKAAGELKERIRMKLLEAGEPALANGMATALVGTVNSVCGNLLSRFSYEAGLSPGLKVIGEEDEGFLFRQAIAPVIKGDAAEQIDELGHRFGFNSGRDRYEWTADVKRIIEFARTNNLKKEYLRKSAENSTRIFMGVLPEPAGIQDGGFEKQLLDSITNALAGINTDVDTTKTTRDYILLLKQVKNQLSKGQQLQWNQWVKLVNLDPGAKSRDAVVGVKEAAGRYESHPILHENISTFISLMFGLAEKSLESYAEFKKERGLIDFIDQEEQVLRILDYPQVKERLADELDLILVDEFQDTSPIQLAIFLKLVQLAKHSIWMGDPKQSIYGFRGSDPELMSSLLKKIGSIDEKDILDTSYRSRPGLVYWANAHFCKAFGQLFPAEQVALEPERKENVEFDSPLNMWIFRPEAKAKNEDYFTTLAETVRNLIDHPPLIEDRETNSTRKLRPSDVALLFATHAECHNAVSSLKKAGVDAAYPGFGLLNTPEATLVLACLRLLADPKETLAKAELLLLSNTHSSVESVLHDRLEKPDHSWAENHPWYIRLMELRNEIHRLSPELILDQILFRLDVFTHVSKWGRGEQRAGNLERIRSLVTQYEEHNRILMNPASLTGFLCWLLELKENGGTSCAAAGGINSVHVSTYHSAKGLEWPVVIAGSLHKKVKSTVLGCRIIDDRSEFNPLDPLAGRWIRYLFNPFSPIKTNAAPLSRLNESSFAQKEKLLEIQEDTRLLYVGLTRARDYLYLPVWQGAWRSTGTDWIEESLDEPLSLPVESDTYQGPWTWDNKHIPMKMTHFQVEKGKADESTIAAADAKVRVFRPLRGVREYAPYLITPSAEKAPVEGAEIRDVVSYGSPIEPPAGISPDQLGNAVHAMMVLPPVRASLRTEHIFFPFGITDMKFIEGFLKNRRRFDNDMLLMRWGAEEYMTEYPLRMQVNGQLISGQADLVFKTESGFIIIDHKSSIGTEQELMKKALTFSPQLHWYRKILKAATGLEVVGLFINFILAGKMVELVIT